MKVCIAAMIGAAIFGILHMIVMRNQGIKFGAQVAIQNPGNGSIMSYRRRMICTMIIGAAVGAIFFVFATH